MDESSQEIANIMPRDHTKIVVRKRTKRSRPSTTTSSSTTSCDDNNSRFSLSSSVENSEEDEDMARCLILLAQSGTPKMDVENSTNSQKLGVTAEWRADLCVYECKTCNLSFPSFQALGGHRASHKKPKTEGKQVDHDHQDEENAQKNKMIIPSGQTVCVLNSKAKVHECSICGSEFASGQALGGHMRRHRSNPITNTTTNTNIITDVTSDEKASNVLQLDLNLPAPEDDRRIRFLYSTTPAPPPLVGCHY